MKTYAEKLRDPRWQRKRLEVMQSAGFACQECEATEKTLNVHHAIYRRGFSPWDYSLDDLRCLCEGCHEKEHVVRTRLSDAMALMDISDIEQIVGYAEGLLVGNRAVQDSLKVSSIYIAMGVSDAVAAHPMGDIEVLDLVGHDGLATSETLHFLYRKRRANER